MTTVLEAAKTLLSVCDGARAKDGEGFNKFDSRFIRSIIEKGKDLTERQEQVIYKLLRKYTVQLNTHNIHYEDIQQVAERRVYTVNNTTEPMVLDFVDDHRLPLFKLHSRIDFAKKAKSIATAWWHPETKTWTYSPTVQFFDGVKEYIKDGIIKTTDQASAKLVELSRIKARLEKVQDIKTQTPASDNSMPCRIKPFSHQIKAFQIGTTVDQAALLMEQGTGKTLSAISIAGARYLKGEIKRLLVLAPLSVVSVWKNEFEKIATFSYTVRVFNKKEVLDLREAPKGLDVLVINYESAWRIIEKLIKWNPGMIIADESQKIKNGRAKQSKGLHKLGDQVKYKLILSGTPVTQGPMDVWSQYRFLNPTIFGRKFLSFREKYAVMGGYGGYQIVAYKNLPELADKAHSIAYRVTKAEALDLPAQVDQVVTVPLEPEAKEQYKQLEKDFILEFGNGKEVKAPIVLTQLLRLQQITGGFVPVESSDVKLDGEPNEITEVMEISKAKLDMVKELLEDFPHNKKVVIFARFIPEIEALNEIADQLKRKTVIISGTHKNRAESIEKFQNDPEVTILIAQIQTGGLGITLTASDTVIFYSTTFSFADYEQAKARVHRIGQAHSVTYIHILAEDTVDEDILKILQSKGNMAKLIVDTLSRKFSKKPFTSSSNRDIINLIETKEDSEMTEETKGTTTTAPETDAKADLKNKLAKIKKSSEAKAPTAKKVAEKPHVEKNKVKDTKAEKKEKKVSKTSNPKLILLKDLAAEAGLNPRDVRKVLRKTFKRPEGSSWSWEKGDSELAAVKAELKKIAKAASKK